MFTIGRLINLDKEGLEQIRHLGEGSLREIKYSLNKLGLTPKFT
ncbi:DNA-directed RNA polymerase subunit alpha C-terminal domain-containing protein [Metabacillus halosaccharovorans]|nr:hypothetical protein CJ195_24115 [Bacillus sp. UMB0899]